MIFYEAYEYYLKYSRKIVKIDHFSRQEFLYIWCFK